MTTCQLCGRDETGTLRPGKDTDATRLIREQAAEIERLRSENQGLRYQLRHVRSERDDILAERNKLVSEAKQ